MAGFSMLTTSTLCVCLTISGGRQKRTRAFPPHWYTRRGSHNREVTRVKKDVRVNLARCISGDELIPPISLWFSISVAFSFYFSLFSLGSLSRNVFPSARFAFVSLPLSFSLIFSSFFLDRGYSRSFLATTHRRVPLYLWRT